MSRFHTRFTKQKIDDLAARSKKSSILIKPSRRGRHFDLAIASTPYDKNTAQHRMRSNTDVAIPTRDRHNNEEVTNAIFPI